MSCPTPGCKVDHQQGSGRAARCQGAGTGSAAGVAAVAHRFSSDEKATEYLDRAEQADAEYEAVIEGAAGCPDPKERDQIDAAARTVRDQTLSDLRWERKGSKGGRPIIPDRQPWDGIEPDDSDYEDAATDAVEQTGIPYSAIDGNMSWNSQAPAGENLAFKARFSARELDTDYMTTERRGQAEAVLSEFPDRQINITPWAPPNQGGNLQSDTIYVGVELNPDERERVIQELEKADEGSPERMLESWERADPRTMDDTFGWSSMRKHGWDPVDQAVQKQAGSAWKARQLATDLVSDASSLFEGNTDFLGTEEWQADIWEQRHDNA